MANIKKVKDIDLNSALFELFRNNGFAEVSISDISKATTLGKPSLYHRFPDGKEQMAKVALDVTLNWLNKEVFSVLKDQSLKPDLRIRKVLKTLDTAHDGGKKGCILNSLLLGAPDSILSLISLSYKEWFQGLVFLMLDAGISKKEAKLRAEKFMVLYEGALVVSRGTGKVETFRRTLKMLPGVLFTPAI